VRPMVVSDRCSDVGEEQRWYGADEPIAAWARYKYLTRGKLNLRMLNIEVSLGIGERSTFRQNGKTPRCGSSLRRYFIRPRSG